MGAFLCLGNSLLLSLSIQIENRSVDPDDITFNQLSAYISAANSAISQFDLEIRSSLVQTPKRPAQDSQDTSPARVFALVNTTSDPLTQLATTYSADEIAFVKRILDYMFDTNNTRRCEGMVISPMQAIQLARNSSGQNNRRSMNAESQTTQSGGAAQSLSMTQAESMMKRLVEEGWLEKSRKDYFSLTPRGLMELRGWLVSTYNDETANRIKSCNACGDIVTVVRLPPEAPVDQDLCLSDRINRANDVASVIAWVDSTTTACGTSSVSSRPSDAPSAKRSGLVINLLENGLWRRAIADLARMCIRCLNPRAHRTDMRLARMRTRKKTRDEVFESRNYFLASRESGGHK